MTRKQAELAEFIRERVSADSMRLIVDFIGETLKEHIEYMIGVSEGGEALVRRQGRAQGLQEAMQSLGDIHKGPREGGARNN